MILIYYNYINFISHYSYVFLRRTIYTQHQCYLQFFNPYRNIRFLTIKNKITLIGDSRQVDLIDKSKNKEFSKSLMYNIILMSLILLLLRILFFMIARLYINSPGLLSFSSNKNYYNHEKQVGVYRTIFILVINCLDLCLH